VFTQLRRLLLGRPLPTAHAIHTLLPKRLALAVFSSDALSSTAYATEEILRVLMLAGAGGVAAIGLAWPIALGIAAVLIVVGLSYRQTIFAYPRGASAYQVAQENLGQTASLIAGGALLVDYVLTVAVSVAAGMAAFRSALPSTSSGTVGLCLVAIGLITLFNLRGARESGLVFAVPTYGFVAMMGTMLVLGMVRLFTGGLPEAPADAWSLDRATTAALAQHGDSTLAPLSVMVVLRAFTAGCTALTGIEAISDGIPAFKAPQARNAARTLIGMIAILTSLFVGMTYLAFRFHLPAIPETAPGYETVISQLGHRIFTGAAAPLYYLLMAFSTGILIVAANTAFQDFPRLASLLARDGFLPRQFGDLGDRLVLSNGMFVLASLAAVLVVLFRGEVSALLPLYAVGVFTSFTLSQASMVRHWLTERSAGWQGKALMSTIGGLTTGVVLVVIAITKWASGGTMGIRVGDFQPHVGAWLVLVFVPLLVVAFRKIRGHYDYVARMLQVAQFPEIRDVHTLRHTVLVLVPGLHRGVFPALEYARSISADTRAVHIETDPARSSLLKEEWERSVAQIPLIILESPFRNLREPLTEYVAAVLRDRLSTVDSVTVVIPELVATHRWWHRLLHGQAAAAMRRSLNHLPGVVVTNARYFVEEPAAS
jgi:amino acid transporter